MTPRISIRGDLGGRSVIGGLWPPRVRLTTGSVFSRVTPELLPGPYYAPGYNIDDGELYYFPRFSTFNIDVRDSSGSPTVAPGISSPAPDIFRYMPDGSGVWGPYADTPPEFNPAENAPYAFEYVNSYATYFDGREDRYIPTSYSLDAKITQLRITGFVSGSFLEAHQLAADDFWENAPVWSPTEGRIFPTVGASMTFNFSHYRAAEFYLHAVGTSASGWHHMLLSPRHVIGAYHVMASPGDTLYWVDATGTLRTSTVLRKTEIAGVDPGDLGIIYLSTPVTGITPISLIGPDTLSTSQILGNYVDGSNGQVFGTGWQYDDTSAQRREFSLKAFYLRRNPKYVSFFNPSSGTVPNSSHSLNVMLVGHSSGAIKPPAPLLPSAWSDAELMWFGGARGGDSGSPMFFMHDGKFVGLTAMFTISGGPAWCRYVREITATMNSIKDPGDPVVYAPDLV